MVVRGEPFSQVLPCVGRIWRLGMLGPAPRGSQALLQRAGRPWGSHPSSVPRHLAFGFPQHKLLCPQSFLFCVSVLFMQGLPLLQEAQLDALL